MPASRRDLVLSGALAALGALPRGALAQAPATSTPTPAAPRSSSGGGRGPLPAAGQEWRLPDEVQLFDGTVLRPVHDRRSVLVLYWWASWCPFCAMQSPLLDALWRKHRNAGLQMLGLSIDKTRDEAVAYLRNKGFGFPSTWVTPEIERVMPRPKWLPVTLVLGRDGKVLTALPGQSFPEDIEDIARFL
jgi:thiol-disulfide isomerase/thioredoxin